VAGHAKIFVGAARNRVFSENIARWPETGFFREFFVTAEDIAKNPVSLVFMRGEKPGFFREYRYTA